MIVGNDQDGDDSVITAHVCMILFLPFTYHKIYHASYDNFFSMKMS